ncbi:SHD1-domain-containing protein, partial [Fistulina hepatica ATCC 64428]
MQCGALHCFHADYDRKQRFSISSSTVDQYLAVLKASYDYQPQPGADDEIAIKEDPLLFLVERVDDDWWKVKVKGDNLDEDSPVGLVPAAYVEPVSASSDLRQRIPTSVVRAVYDYATNAPGELTVVEDDVLYVFDTEDEGQRVQSKAGDKAGYVPGNYVEAITEEEAEAGLNTSTRPIVWRTRGASAADPTLTWAISEVDKKGKKKKGTLGVGNGSFFFASESDKGPVRKWSTKQVDLVAIEKHKRLHVAIVDGDGTPVELHFHTGGKEIADAIQEKLEASKALAVEADAQMMGEITGKTSHEQMDHGVDDIELDKRLDQIEVPALPPPARKPTAHFSSAEPVIILAPIDDEEEEVEVDEGDHVMAAYDFHADGDDELSVVENETLVVLEKDGEWWKCRNALGAEGVVPTSYLEVIHDPSQTTSVPDLQDAQRKKEEELRRREEELSRREQEQRAREEERKRKQMEQQERAKAMVKERQEVEVCGHTNSLPPKADATGGSHVSRPSMNGGGRRSGEVPREGPDPNRTRIWHDRTGQFRVEAAFLGMTNGKIRLHEVNGVVVEVPEGKMSLDDMRYIECLTNGNSSPSTSNPKPL